MLHVMICMLFIIRSVIKKGIYLEIVQMLLVVVVVVEVVHAIR